MKMKMFRKLSCLALATLAFLSVNAAEDDGALLWMIGSDSTVNRFGTIYSLGEFNDQTGFNHGPIEYVRIAATSATGDTVYLHMADETGLVDPDDYGGTSVYIDFDDIGPNGEYVLANWASLASLDGDLASYSFAVQLGTWNEVGDDLVWNIEALSDGTTYADIQKFTSNSPTAQPYYGPWNPGAYNIPEPSAGLLMLIGLGLAALRRKEERK